MAYRARVWAVSPPHTPAKKSRAPGSRVCHNNITLPVPFNRFPTEPPPSTNTINPQTSQCHALICGGLVVGRKQRCAPTTWPCGIAELKSQIASSCPYGLGGRVVEDELVVGGEVEGTHARQEHVEVFVDKRDGVGVVGVNVEGMVAYHLL